MAQSTVESATTVTWLGPAMVWPTVGVDEAFEELPVLVEGLGAQGFGHDMNVEISYDLHLHVDVHRCICV